MRRIGEMQKGARVQRHSTHESVRRPSSPFSATPRAAFRSRHGRTRKIVGLACMNNNLRLLSSVTSCFHLAALFDDVVVSFRVSRLPPRLRCTSYLAPRTSPTRPGLRPEEVAGSTPASPHNLLKKIAAARHIIHVRMPTAVMSALTRTAQFIRPTRLLSTALNAAVHIDEDASCPDENSPPLGLPCSSSFVATATTLAARESAELICHGHSRSPPLPSLVLTRRHHRRRLVVEAMTTSASSTAATPSLPASRCALHATLKPGRPGG
ncbi:hypothetical protein EV714DRAFT_271210 [Schizophyllum commune]